MKLTRIFLSLVLIVFVSTALAAKPDKELVCHVGNDMGSANQTYMENPDCILPQDWDESVEGEFRCPDAGKIDLILVSKKSKHGETHFFAGTSDYAPVLEGAGDDPADFEDSFGDGIDDGCLYALCPCAVDEGDAGLMWRFVTEARSADLVANVCHTFRYAPYIYRTATFLPDGGDYEDYFKVFVDNEPGYYGDFAAVCGTYQLPDTITVLPTSELQHNACVRLIDSAFGEVTDRVNGDDCTLAIR